MTSTQDDQLLQLSSFLASFGSLFQGSDEAPDRIDVNSLKEAIRYDIILNERHRLGYHVGNNNNDAGNQLEEEIDRVQSEIASVPKDVRLLHRMLKRFAVHMTQDLVHTHFMIPPSRSHSEGGSTLLNLPSAAHMPLEIPRLHASVAQKRKRKHKPNHTCIITPNHWTWPEFLRLSFMVAQLPCPPPHSIAVSNFGATKEDVKTNGRLSQADLVALWVRAQRNTSAWRHLTQLFHVEPKQPGRGKHLAGEIEYRATFQGNNSRLSTIVKRDAFPMDALVEWAVTNQVLFTERWIVAHIDSIPKVVLKLTQDACTLPTATNVAEADRMPPAEADKMPATEADKIPAAEADKMPATEADKIPAAEADKIPADQDSGHLKRPAEETELDDEHVASIKRARMALDVDQQLALTRAKHCFLFRWFARRNIHSTSILWTNTPNIMAFHVYSNLTKPAFEAHVIRSVKDILLKDYNSMNRIFSRFDRRLTKTPGDQIGDELCNVVWQALDALKRSTNALDEADFQESNADFKLLYDYFLGKEAIGELVSADCSVEQQVQLLESVAPPWPTHNCHVCNQQLKEDDKMVVCSNCERHIHAQCCGAEHEATLRDICNCVGPLRQTYMVRTPLSPPLPDFRSDLHITWERREVRFLLRRKKGIRIGVIDTEKCKSALNDLSSGKMVASELLKEEVQATTPFITDYNGLVVTDVLSDSPAGAAGIRVGDIITHAKQESVAETGKEIDPKLPSHFVCIADLSREARIKFLLNMDVGIVAFIIQRPSESILERGQNWFLRLTEVASKSVKRALEDNVKQRFCKHCEVSEPSDRDRVEEARRCLAVIRRLCMESYSLPFHEEQHLWDDDIKHTSCVSFRRLEQMMIAIIKSQALSGGGYSWAFSEPPCLDSDGKLRSNHPKRLEWMFDELADKPYELLCRGMQILLTPPIALDEDGIVDDPISSDRSSLASHFLDIYTAWVVLSTFQIVGCVPTKGPPTDYSYLSSPWVHPTCKFCMLPILHDPSSPSCDRNACRAVSSYLAAKERELVSDGEVLGDRSGSTTPAAANETKQQIQVYRERASYVGSVIMVLPGDPMLNIPAHFLQQEWIRTNNKPTPFIVASYLPSFFVDLKPGRCVIEDYEAHSDGVDGMFFLLPVVYSKQLNYLQKPDLAKMRAPPSDTEDKNSLRAWAQMQILDLPGVVWLTPHQLCRRASETQAIMHSISKAVLKIACCSSDQELTQIGCEDGESEKGVICSAAHEALSETTSSSTRLCTSVTRVYQDAKVTLRSLETSYEFTSSSSHSPIIKAMQWDDDLVSKYSALLDTSVGCNSTLIQEALELVDENEVADDETMVDGTSTLNQFSGVPKEAETRKNRGSELSRGTSSGAQSLTVEPFELPCWGVNGEGQRPKISSPMEPIPLMPHNAAATRRNVAPATVDLTQDCDDVGPVNEGNVNQGMRDCTQMRMLRMNDLFRAGPDDTFVTRAEAAVVVGLLKQHLPQLARRILCPRYRWRQAEDIVRKIQLMDHSLIPVLPDDLLKGVMHEDFKRSTTEGTQPIIARDRVGDQVFEYRLPKGQLSIDLFILLKLRSQLDHHQGTSLTEPPQGMMHEPPPPPHQHPNGTHFNVQFQNAGQPGGGSPPTGNYPQGHRYGNAMEFHHNWNDNGGSSLPYVPPSRKYQSSVHLPSLWYRNEYRGSLPHSDMDNSPRDIQDGPRTRNAQTTSTHSNEIPQNLRTVGSSQRPGLKNANEVNAEKENAGANGSKGACHNIRDISRGSMSWRLDQLERIRGGGGDKERNQESLQRLSALEWGGNLVFGKIKTRRDGEEVEATMVGFIEKDLNELNEAGTAEVKAFFISNHGILESPTLLHLPVRLLSFVEEGSEEAGIADHWRTNQERDRQSRTRIAVRQEEDHAPPQPALPQCVELAKRLAHSRTGSISLGYLPDGRVVYWMSCNPNSLKLLFHGGNRDMFTSYVTKASTDFSTIVRLGAEKSTDTDCYLAVPQKAYCCFWGCSVRDGEDNDQCLSFSTQEELLHHLDDRHHHGTVADKKEMVTVATGLEIMAIAADLCAAICARWPQPMMELLSNDYENPIPESVQFDLKSVLNALEKTNESQRLFQSYPGDKTGLRQLLRLWSRIARLFDLNHGGRFCVDPRELRTFRSPLMISKEDNNEVVVDHCFDNKVSLNQLQFTQCQLCCSGAEQTIEMADGEHTSLGCNLLSSILQSGRRQPSLSAARTPSLSLVKSLLLQIATSTPQALRLEPSVKTPDRPPTEVLWDDGHFQSWCQFVREGDNERVLAQAFVVLLANLNKNKLPAYWRSASAGWSKPFVLMTHTTTVSGLLLHLYVLDAAMVEFLRMSGATAAFMLEISHSDDPYNTTHSPTAGGNIVKSDPLPKELRGMKSERIMKTIVSWANQLSLSEFQGNHGEFCLVCEDGGELLCCEYCDNVIHGQCCNPPIWDISKIEKWVCDGCIKDISELMYAGSA